MTKQMVFARPAQDPMRAYREKPKATPNPNICSKCGSAEEVSLVTVDGACDERGNSIGVPLCVDCTEGEPAQERTEVSA